jgi:hypothetical protein
VNQAELRRMSEERIQDARVLIDGGRYEFGYYAAGYAVECALKSCLLARMIHTAWVFEERWKAQDCLTHDFGELTRLAGLTDALNNRLAVSARVGDLFIAHWGRALQWKVASRYESKTEADAKDLFSAITHTPDRVMEWIRNYW